MTTLPRWMEETARAARRPLVVRQGQVPGPRSGFTLIEILATLAVTALFISVVLPFAGRLVARWQTGEATVQGADAWLQAVSRMSDDLAQAVPYGLGPDPRNNAAFRAGPAEIRLVRSALGDPNRLETIVYEARQTSAGAALVRRSRPFDALAFDQDQGAGSTAATLVDGPIRLRFDVLAPDGTRHADWTPANGMPAAVELSARSDRPGLVPITSVLMPISARAPALATKPGASPPSGQPP